MGSTGSNSLINKPTSDTSKYTVFDSYTGSIKWFDNDKNSNSSKWVNNLLTPDEKDSIVHYTGSYYKKVNSALYTTKWDDMSDYDKEHASNIYNGLNKFELKNGIETVRGTDFQVFGAEYGDKMTLEQVAASISGKKCSEAA